MDEIVPDEEHQDEMEIDPNKLNLCPEMLYRVQNMMMPAQRDFFLKQAKQEKDKLDRDTAEYLKRQEESMKTGASDQVDEYGLPVAPKKTNDTAATLATLPDNDSVKVMNDYKRCCDTLNAILVMKSKLHIESDKAKATYESLQREVQVLDAAVDAIQFCQKIAAAELGLDDVKHLPVVEGPGFF